MNPPTLEVGSRVFLPHFCLFLLTSDSTWKEYSKRRNDSMAYKNGIYEIAQDVKFNWAEGPVATGEMGLCFPQCTAPETHWSCVQSLWDPSLLRSHGRATNGSRGWRKRHKVCREPLFLDCKIYLLFSRPFHLLSPVYRISYVQFTSTFCILDVNGLQLYPLAFFFSL